MSDFFKRYRSEVILFIILFIAAVLRFYNYSVVSLSNDELSAITRTRFENVSGLIKGGVETDAHPAGIQLFMYYWKNLFGDSPGSMRLPFVIAGVLSVLFIYLLTKKWVNKTAALFTASSLCFLEYPVLYSQIARPYSMGLFFCLSTAYFWSRILFNSNKPFIRDFIGFIISAGLATYTHYFSFLTVAIFGVTGLFFIKKNTWKQYLISGLVIFILFIPHLSITFKQLGYGLSWLGKPEKGWILDYIGYCFNNSTFLLLFLFSVLTASIIINYKNLLFSKFQFLSILFFLLPFLIGYFYSVYKTPVLQYSVLIFSFPFLLIFLFSFIPEEPKPYIYVILLLLTISGISSTVFEKKFYTTQHFAEFKGIAEHIVKWNNKYGEQNITRTININAPYYIHYYLTNMGDSSKFEKYKFTEGKDLGDLIEILNQCKTPYFLYSFSNTFNQPEINEIIREKFPVIAEQNAYLGSEVTLYKRDSLYSRPCLYHIKNDFENKYSMWDFDSSMVDTIVVLSGKQSCMLDEKKIYSPGFVSYYINFPCKDSCIISIFVNAYLTENATAEIVFSIEKPGRENEWYGSNINNMVREKQKWGKAYFTHFLGTDYDPQDKIKIYVWNTGKDKLYIDDFCIQIYEKK